MKIELNLQLNKIAKKYLKSKKSADEIKNKSEILLLVPVDLTVSVVTEPMDCPLEFKIFKVWNLLVAQTRLHGRKAPIKDTVSVERLSSLLLYTWGSTELSSVGR